MIREFSNGLDVALGRDSGEPATIIKDLDQSWEVFMNAAEVEEGRIISGREREIDPVVLNVPVGAVRMGEGAGVERHFGGRTDGRKAKGAIKDEPVVSKCIDVGSVESTGAIVG